MMAMTCDVASREVAVRRSARTGFSARLSMFTLKAVRFTPYGMAWRPCTASRNAPLPSHQKPRVTRSRVVPARRLDQDTIWPHA